jgi:tripartite-type tricarboxylate transporter receptor subunit TctC
MARFAPRCTVLALALLAFAATPLSAQDYPSKTVTIVVPLAAGTGMDTIARIYGEKLAERLGKPVVIENRPGAAMIPPAQSVVAAPADGHTLMVATPTQLSTNQVLFKQLPYNPEKDFVPISHYLMSPFILVVNPALPVKSVPEFIKYAKEQATPLSYSSPAGGGVPHYAVEVVRQRFDLKLTHVPYRSSPQSIIDIAAGHVNFAFAETGASRSLIQQGDLKALAVSSKQRVPVLPDIAPFAEVSGMPDFEIVAWHILVARSGTPRPIVERLNAEMKQIMADPEIGRRIAGMGLIPITPPPITETERYLKDEAAKWRKILTSMGLDGSM